VAKSKTTFAGNPNSQYDPGLIAKEVHDFFGQANRVLDARSVTRFYSHFRATYNGDSLPDEVTYYHGTLAHRTQVGVLPDIGGSLNNKYLFIHSSPDAKKYHLWFNVDGLGTDPAPAGSIPIEVGVMSNDPAVVVATAITLTLNNLFGEVFYAVRTQTVVEIATVGLGVTTNSADFNTLFSITNTPGTQDIVTNLVIPYDGQDPIYNGQVLKSYRFNIFEGKFENIQGGISIIDSGGDELDINPNGSINVVLNPGGTIVSKYSEVTGIVMGITTLVVSYTAPSDATLQKVSFSGTNIAEYELIVDGITVDKGRTYFGSALNGCFDFGEGIEVLSGKVVELYVVHNRTPNGDFNGRIQSVES
jgi:hypothetical protein